MMNRLSAILSHINLTRQWFIPITSLVHVYFLIGLILNFGEIIKSLRGILSVVYLRVDFVFLFLWFIYLINVCGQIKQQVKDWPRKWNAILRKSLLPNRCQVSLTLLTNWVEKFTQSVVVQSRHSLRLLLTLHSLIGCWAVDLVLQLAFELTQEANPIQLCQKIENSIIS